MAKHKPGTLYCTHKLGVYPNAQICTVDKSSIKIRIFPWARYNGVSFTMSRQFAKMLARRINQCLEDTK
jgi:hypothetical protein